VSIVLGCIADDFTGATDLANMLVQQGMPTIQLIGTPENKMDIGRAKAVVIALKSRTMKAEKAVSLSINALKWLRAAGAKQFLFKYCSTFDSTDQGNIGPVADALKAELGLKFTIVCPAFPENGRTVYNGNLFVFNDLLSESNMRDHPLTPMTDSNLLRVLGRQTTQKIGLIEHQTVAKGPDAINKAYDKLQKNGVRYAIVDAIYNEDLLAIGTASKELVFITGGSGIALGLPSIFREAKLIEDAVPPTFPMKNGARVVLAGSCSVRTIEQIAKWKEKFPALRIAPEAVMQGKPVVREAVKWALRKMPDTPILIYTSDSPNAVTKIQKHYNKSEVGRSLEKIFGAIAQQLVKKGADRVIVAGGETSGAVVKALDVSALKIGPEITYGVPWTETIGKTQISLALKSGNFGDIDFFNKAFKVLG